MSARRRSSGGFHGVVAFVRRLVEAFRGGREGDHADRGRGRRRRNPWPQCPLCYRRVPTLCTDAEEGAEPCGNGISCGCCHGPHRAEKSAGQDGGKFTTSVERA